MISTGKHTLIGGRQIRIILNLCVMTPGSSSFGLIVTFSPVFFPIPQSYQIVLLNEVKILLVTVAF